MTPVVEIVIKSYPKDYEWLSYCLRSIQKFCHGFNGVVVLLPKSAPLVLTAEKVVLLDVEEGYLSQQVAKLNADHHTKADYILHFDSDMIFTKHVTPEFFFRDGKPVWTITPWWDLEKGREEQPLVANTKKPWFGVMAECLLECPPYEFMRKCAVIAPRWIYKDFRDFFLKEHKVSMEEYVMNQPPNRFSEYNCLGFFAWLNHRDKFYWNDTTVDGFPTWPFMQKWSYGGLTPEIRAEFERILA